MWRLAIQSVSRPHLRHHLWLIFSLALLLFGLWVVLSSKIDVSHLVAGAMAALVIAVATCNLLLLPPLIGFSREHPLADVRWRRVPLYLLWLSWEIILAGLQVARVVLHPRLPTTPRLVRFRIKLPHTLARLVLANSITLTPGTVTLDVDGDDYLVHALTENAARAIEDGIMLTRVSALFVNQEDHTERKS